MSKIGLLRATRRLSPWLNRLNPLQNNGEVLLEFRESMANGRSETVDELRV